MWGQWHATTPSQLSPFVRIPLSKNAEKIALLSSLQIKNNTIFGFVF